MTKLLIIGIDGMDRELVQKYLDSLPNFRKIIIESNNFFSKSVFPPDSDTAWASIYTGLNPAKHGIVDFVDPLEREKIVKKESEYLDRDVIKGKTFWDILSKQNKKSCILFPHIAYPVWPVNGLMINKDPENGIMQYYPEDFKFNLKFKNIKITTRLPRTKMEYKKYLNSKREIVRNEFELARDLLRADNWDVFFLYSSALDSIMHLFWNYCDPNDPTYPGKNQFDNVIKDMHILYDSMLGNLLENIDKSTSILIFSDHGHSMRPINLFNINEILRLNGFLKARQGKITPFLNSKEKLKRKVVDIAQKYGLRPFAQTILRMFPKLKKVYTKPSTIDFSRTIAHCTDLSGMKAYTYGGIVLNKNLIKSEKEYEEVRDNIIKILKEYKIPDTEENVVEWALKREEVYKGEYLFKYPDIIFELQKNYGVGWDINLPVFTKSSSHKFFPGSHRGATPIFYFINKSGKNVIKNKIELVDISPSILTFLGINTSEYSFDGESFLK